jgi:hypothetical protein
VPDREDSRDAVLRGFVSRVLGWSPRQAGAVEEAICSIRFSVERRAALVILNDGYPVPLALALHRRTLGAEHPFVVADRRRGNMPASVRSPKNLRLGGDALEAASGGSLCVRYGRLPYDFPSVVRRVRDADKRVQFIVCASARFDTHPFLTLPVPIRVPPLRTRAGELPRIVDEYRPDRVRPERRREARGEDRLHDAAQVVRDALGEYLVDLRDRQPRQDRGGELRLDHRERGLHVRPPALAC